MRREGDMSTTKNFDVVRRKTRHDSTMVSVSTLSRQDRSPNESKLSHLPMLIEGSQLSSPHRPSYMKVEEDIIAELGPDRTTIQLVGV